MLELLETRTTPTTTSVPTVALSAPSQAFIGATPVPISLTFTNTGNEVGYAPWAYVILDSTGAAGHDGVSFVNGSATYLGDPVTTVVSTINASGDVTGPSFSGNLTLTNDTAYANDQIVFFQLPFGSFAVGQPGAAISFNTTISNQAYLGTPLALQAEGGFALGNNATGTGPTGQPIDGSSVNTSVTPILIQATKTYIGPADINGAETATGANFPEKYTIAVDIANGQTVNNLVVQDVLPNSMQYVQVDSVLVDGSAITPVFAATNTATTTTPGGTLALNLGTVTGATGSPYDAADVTFTFYVPRDTSTMGQQVLNLATGAQASATDQASASGHWVPTPATGNPNAPQNTTSNVATATLQEMSLATQKSVVVVGGGPAVPGATLQYTINFQVSDYFAFQDVSLQDILGDGTDGLAFDTSVAPTLSFNQQGANTTAAFNTNNYTVNAFNPANGSQTIVFDLSNELITRGQNGNMVGGSIPLAGTGGSATLPQNSNPSPYGGTQGTITFDATILYQFNVYKDPLTGDQYVTQGDTLNNQETITGNVLSYANTSNTSTSSPVTTQSDTAAAAVQVVRGQLTKTIYAITHDGVTTIHPSTLQVTPGDTVTYELTYVLPTSTVEDLAMTDYMPLPIYNATQITTFDSTNNSNTTPPAAGTAEFGPNDTYATVFGTPATPNYLANYVPTIATAAATNTVVFTFPTELTDYNTVQTTEVDILFSVTVTDAPFADGLFLTNQANAQEGSSQDTATQANSIVQVQLTEPSIPQIEKGVVQTTATGTNYTPSTSSTFAPVTFNTPGTTGSRFTGTIDANNLATTPIDKSLTGVEAGQNNNLVTFAVTVENMGMGPNGAYDVEVNDTMPAGFVLPTDGAGLNLQVFNGAGTALSFTSVGTGFFGSGSGNYIELNAPLGAFNATNGLNIAVITYDLQLATTVQPDQKLTNTATLENYANEEGGPNFITSAETAKASVTADNVVPTKSLVTTSETATTSSDTTVTNPVIIGDIVRYELLVQVPQANSPGFQLLDNLPVGMSFINDGTAMAELVSPDGKLLSSTLSGTGLDSTSITAPTFVLPSGAISSAGSDGASVTFSFGTLTNNDTDTADAEYVVVEFNALVDNVTNNTNGATLNNDFAVIVNSTTLATSNKVPVTVQLPVLSITRTETDVTAGPNYDSNTTAEEGDTVDFTVTVTNTGSATGFETSLASVSPGVSSYLAIQGGVAISEAGGATGAGSTSPYPLLAFSGATLPVGGSVTLTYAAVVQAGVLPGQQLMDTVEATTNTLPGTNGYGTVGGTNTTGSSNTNTPGSGTGERTGSGYPTVPTLNNLFASGVEVLTVETPGPQKYLVSVSEVPTTSSNVTIGEVARYELVTELPRSTMPNFQLDDLLPAGMSFLPGNTDLAFVSATGTYIADAAGTAPVTTALSGAGLDVTSSSVSTVTPTYDIDGIAGAIGTDSNGDPEFNLGSITDSGTGTVPEYVVLEFNALVDNVASNFSGVTLTNTYDVLIDPTGSLATQVGLASNPVTVTVVEPKVANLTETVADNTTGNATGDAGDLVTYTVTWSNSGNSTAFNVDLTDPLPATSPTAYETLQGTPTVTPGGTGAVTGISTAGTTGNTVNVILASMAPGASVTVTYTATIDTTVPPAQVINNAASLTYTSLPGTNGTTSNPTGGQTPGLPGSPTGQRTGSGTSPNTYDTSAPSTFTVHTNTITGFVYWDETHAGMYVAGDPLLAGVQVKISGTDNLGNAVSTTVTTTAGGAYQFPNLRPGTYTISELTQPTGYLDYEDTAGNVGNPFGGTLSAVGVDTITNIKIPAESNITEPNYNFGKVLPVSVAGTVYQDLNASGVLVAGDPGIGGVGLSLTGTNDLGAAVSLTTTTSTTAGSVGTYSFTGLRPGTYIITETTQPAGYLDGKDTAGLVNGVVDGTVQAFGTDQITAIALVQANNGTGYNFAKVLPSSISGNVYDDLGVNSNKTASDPGLGAVTVTLTGTNDLGQSVNVSTTSTASGSYSFANQRPSLPGQSYTLTVGMPATGYIVGTTWAGTPLGGVGSPSAPATQITSIVVTPGSVGVNYNFAEDRIPTTANDTVGTTVNVPYTFTSANFPFADPSTGTTFHSITITSLPGVGTLTLNGSPVTVGEVIPVGLIGQLVYTPPANQIGTPLTSFNFTVSDGIASSVPSVAIPATMFIDVWAPPSIAPITDVYLANCTVWPFTYTGTLNDTSNLGPYVGTVSYGDGSATQVLTANAAGSFMLGHTYTQRGVYDVVLSLTDGREVPATATTSFWVGCEVNVQPQAYGTPTTTTAPIFTINDGNVQRSMIQSLTVTFAGNQTLSAGALTLTTASGQAVGTSLLTRYVAASNETFVYVQFTSTTLIGDSLADGNYSFKINDADVHNTGGSTVYDGGGIITDTFWRLFGDVYGNDMATAAEKTADLNAMEAAMRSTNGTAPYKWYLDYDQNCVIDQNDLNQFLLRYEA